MQINVIATIPLLLHHFTGEFNFTESLNGIITHVPALECLVFIWDG